MDEVKLAEKTTDDQIQPIIFVKNISKIYKGKSPTTAVSNLSFDIMPGEIFGFIGPDGAVNKYYSNDDRCRRC